MTKKMKVLIVEPRKEPFAAEIASGLHSLQQIVGGTIQAVYPFIDEVALIAHDEGKLIRLPWNRPLYDEDGRLYDILVGTFLVVGLTENDFEVKSILSHALIEVIVLRYISAKKSNPKGENLGFNQFALSKSNSFSTIITSMNCILLQKLTYFIIYQFVLNFK